tara:strand:+ start:199 stop:672 length:474 start_codon:yes stop_codon:yes gene_type:complete
MARITIAEAVKAGYKSRSQINKDIRPNKKGIIKLATHEDRGKKLIDVADLIALYGEPGSKAAPAPIPTTKADADRDRENEELKVELQQIKAELADARRTIDDKDKAATEERQKFMELVENSQKQIEDMRSDRERVEKRDKEIMDELRKPFIKRLFGG